jgi:hypothetical protein
LSDTERRALAGLKRDLQPPPGAEARTVAALRARGLLRSTSSRRLQWIAAACVVAGAFAAGTLWQRTARQSDTIRGPRFMLLLYGGETNDAGDRRNEYAGWARSIAMSGIGISGEELSGIAEEIPSTPQVDQPPATMRPRGYFIVSTSTIDEARRIAESCPHLRYGGRISIRPIVAGP